MTVDTDLRARNSGDEALQIARRIRSQFRFGLDDQDGNLVRLAPGNLTRLVQQLAPTVTRSVLQIVPLAGYDDATGSFPDAVWQSLAEDPDLAVTVRRLYLLAPGDTLPASGRTTGRFEVRSSAVRDFIEAQPAALPVRNMWLIDDRVFISEEPDMPGYWQVSNRQVDVRRFVEIWGKLWDRNEDGPHRADILSEPLAQSADMMANVAKMSCNKHLYSEGTCAWYHSIWQYLRLFDLVSSPAWHADFYSNALDEALTRLSVAATGRRPRVLITGTADYSMLAYVLSSAGRTSVPIDVTVMDQCRTPLIACQWYVRTEDSGRNTPDQASSHVDIWEQDIFELLDDGPTDTDAPQFDLIATDAFLTRFEPRMAKQIALIWHRLLAPGGSVVTTVRIHPFDAPRGGILDEVSSFAMKARDRATQWRPYVQVKLDELTTGARQYAMQMRSFDIGGVAAIRSLFTEAGLKIGSDETADVPGELRHARYLRVVARKSGTED